MTTYPNAPTTFEDVIRLVPPRGKIQKHRFVLGDRPFEIQIGRNDMNIVWITFGVPQPHFEFHDVTRKVESLMTQRQVWAVWERFLKDPDEYLTWKRFEVKTSVFRNDRRSIAGD